MTKLQYIRKMSGMTQDKVAEAVGISLGVWRHYEQGSRRFDGAALPLILKTAILFGVKVEDMLESEETIELIKKYNEIA